MLKSHHASFQKPTPAQDKAESLIQQDINSQWESEIGPSKRRTVLTEEGQKYAKLSKWLMQTQGKQQGRSVGSTKSEQIHAKGSQNPNRTSQVLQRNSECRLRVWRWPALISTAVQGSWTSSPLHTHSRTEFACWIKAQIHFGKHH